MTFGVVWCILQLGDTVETIFIGDICMRYGVVPYQLHYTVTVYVDNFSGMHFSKVSSITHPESPRKSKNRK